MQTNLFVDGYNIIGAWQELTKLKDVDLEAARRKLIDEMVEYQATSCYRIVLVFDGHLVKNNKGTQEVYSNIEVIYTKEGETADTMIERLVAHLPKYHRTYVATSDRVEQEFILTKGALRISARELRLWIKEAKLETKKILKRGVSTQRGARNALDAQLSESLRQALKKMMD